VILLRTECDVLPQCAAVWHGAYVAIAVGALAHVQFCDHVAQPSLHLGITCCGLLSEGGEVMASTVAIQADRFPIGIFRCFGREARFATEPGQQAIHIVGLQVSAVQLVRVCKRPIVHTHVCKRE
jgi:hypothetical protein